MKTAAKILGGLAFSVTYVSCDPSHDPNWGGFIFGVILAILATGLYRLGDKTEQYEKDTDAMGRVNEVLFQGKEPFYYLYLRPFSLTNKARMKPLGSILMQDRLKPQPVQSFEVILARAMAADSVPLIALGRPGEAIGAGRYPTTEENWQTTFEALAKAATGIIAVPALTSGTLWEIDWLVRHKLIHKTVFIFPHNLGFDVGKLLAAEYAKLGLHFPEHGSRGIFKLSEEGHVTARFSLEMLQTRDGCHLIQDLKNLERVEPLRQPNPPTTVSAEGPIPNESPSLKSFVSSVIMNMYIRGKFLQEFAKSLTGRAAKVLERIYARQ